MMISKHCPRGFECQQLTSHDSAPRFPTESIFLHTLLVLKMDFDSLAKQRSDLIFQVWVQNLLRNSPEQLAGKLASQHCSGSPVTASRLRNDASNVCYRVTFEDGKRVVVRFTALGRVVARNEKVEDEVAVMRFLAERTSIPVPEVLGHGKCAVGPYIVMSYIEGSLLSGFLRDSSQETVTLNPNIPESALKKAYYVMADILLELSKPGFPFIGALKKVENGWIVPKRPLSFNMNRLASFSNIPHTVFEQARFTTAAEYFEELANQHFYHLEYQRNDAVDDEADCRIKYIARCLFRKVSREISQHCNGPFRLYCDDLSPNNILFDASKLSVTGVIDWEFTYTAPVEFTYAAPWWLLLERPEDWELDLDEFLRRFMPKLNLFLKALEDCEETKIKDGTLLPCQRLSPAMEKSMKNGLFWVCLASRHSSMFDEIYWEFLDERFLGPFTTTEDRLHLLSEEEQANIESFTARKMQQAEEKSLDTYLSIDQLVEL